MDEKERLWRWFARIHEMKTGHPMLEADRRDAFTQTLFEYWQSGYGCRKLDEQARALPEVKP